MSPPPLRAALLALLLAAPLPAAADDLAEAFARADLNGDGHLNVDEYVAAVVEKMREMDADGDGFLIRAEIPDSARDAFALADRDGDGRLSLGEAVGDRIIRYFDADSSRDGVVTLEELRALAAMESKQ